MKKVLMFLLLLLCSFMIIGCNNKKEDKKNEEKHSIDIVLNGDDEIILDVFSEYNELGAVAKYDNDDISNDIVVSGEVLSDVPGSYEISYVIESNGEKAEVKRVIKVVDGENPVITLNGKSEVSVYVGNSYKDSGYSAVDNVDKDITNKVNVSGDVDTNTIGEYIVTYTVSDSSNNSTSVTRKVKVIKKPEVKPEQVVTPASVSGLPVLMYHFFYDSSKGEKGNDANWMDVNDFDAQMKYLVDNNYYFPSWDEVLAYVKGTGTLPERSVVVTIDDGDITFINHAIPVIEKYQIKATSFAVTSWNGDWLPTTYGTEHMLFESHSHAAHTYGSNGRGLLVNMTYQQAFDDVSKSRDLIGGSTVFCYPFGHYNDTVIQALKDANYNMAFTTQYGRVKPGQDLYKLPRIRMSRGDSLQTFANKVA